MDYTEVRHAIEQALVASLKKVEIADTGEESVRFANASVQVFNMLSVARSNELQEQGIPTEITSSNDRDPRRDMN